MLLISVLIINGILLTINFRFSCKRFNDLFINGSELISLNFKI